MSKLKSGHWAIIVIVLVLIVDQVSKIWVKTHMYMGEDIVITNWFHIFFTENNGMAYGIELFDKIFLTLFRIGAVALFSYYLIRCIKKGVKKGFIICLSLVIAGAFGNIIDCVFYGRIFSDSYGRIATMFQGDGYAPWFYGRVVDMLYFPLFQFNWPEWVPFIGGNHYLFFRPVFNVADSAITVGVALRLLFYRHSLTHELESSDEKKKNNKDESENN